MGKKRHWYDWGPGDTQAFNSVMKAGQSLQDAWGKYQVGQAYEQGGLETRDYTRQDEQSYGTEDLAKAGAASEAARAEWLANYNPDGTPKSDTYQTVAPVTPQQNGLYRMGDKTSSMPFTQEAKHTAGLQAQMKFHAARGETEEAMKIKERLDQGELRGLQTEAAKDSLARGKRADENAIAYETAVKAIPAAGSYVLDGKVVPKGTEGAKEFTPFDYSNAMRLAAAAGGDHAAAGQWGEKAALHLANQTAMRVMRAASLDDINKGPYAEFTNGKDFIQTKNADGSVSFGHKGEPPLFTASKYDPNPFATFKESLATEALNDPKATLDFHDKSRNMNMKGQELSATLDLKKAIAAQTAEAHAAGNEIRKLVAQGAIDARSDAIAARRGQFVAQSMEKVAALPGFEEPTGDPKSKEFREKHAAWENKIQAHMAKLLENYDAGVAGKAGAPKSGALNLAPPALNNPPASEGLEPSSLDQAVKSQKGWGPLTPDAMLQRGIQLGVPGAMEEAEARARRFQPQAGMPLGDPNYVPM